MMGATSDATGATTVHVAGSRRSCDEGSLLIFFMRTKAGDPLLHEISERTKRTNPGSDVNPPPLALISLATTMSDLSLRAAAAACWLTCLLVRKGRRTSLQPGVVLPCFAHNPFAQKRQIWCI